MLDLLLTTITGLGAAEIQSVLSLTGESVIKKYKDSSAWKKLLAGTSEFFLSYEKDDTDFFNDLSRALSKENLSLLAKDLDSADGYSLKQRLYDTFMHLMRQYDIPYEYMEKDIESQLDAIEILGKVLGSEEEAGEYIDWCRNTYSEVRTALSASLGPKISLYHAVNEATRTDYDGSICAEWIAMTGVRNVSLGSELKLEGEKAYTTLEQIYSWDPDMIICNEPGVDDYILSDPKWAGLRCVREAKVYQIPVGVARMGHPTSTETPLALMWLAELLYPELYDIDYVQVLKDYYHRFYDYDISDDTAEAIIEGDEMRAAKPSGSVE